MESSNNWLLFILILVIIVILVWALLRNRPQKTDLPTHHESENVPPSTSVEEKEISSETVAAQPATELSEKIEESKAVPMNVVDDLEVIEGIGPKIAKLLKDEGIMTFSQLAETDIPRLRSILLAANLRVNDPTSWPTQAKLAALGKFDELKQLQDSLKGGRA